MKLITGLEIIVSYTCYHEIEEEVSYEKDIIIFKNPDTLEKVLLDDNLSFGTFIEDILTDNYGH